MKESLARGFVFGFGFLLGYAMANAVVHQIEWNAKAELAESISNGIRQQHKQRADTN